MEHQASGAEVRGGKWGFLLPAFPELFAAVLVLAAFGRRLSWQSLLSDGDTGFHIRTGEYILHSGKVPVDDLFSFSRPHQPWFAWEWLSDAVFAWLHSWGGLQAIAASTILVLCISGALILAWLLRRGAGLWIATGVTLAVVSASTIHYLARPHIFSILFFPAVLWLLDEDYRNPGRRIWWLPALFALWANLHGGFVGGLVPVAFLFLGTAAQCRWSAASRYALLSFACLGATVLNPYGWRLHQHLIEYLGSNWILDNVQEFQSPRIRTEAMLIFAVLLVGGIACASRSLARGDWFTSGMTMLWGLAALRSARHVPLYAAAAAPVIASELALWARTWRSRSDSLAAFRIFWDSGMELARSARLGIWGAMLAGLALFAVAPAPALHDFPESRFPVAAVRQNSALLTDPASRILTSDQWGDYLIFRLYPRQRVFFDGRSDFYGAALGDDYRRLLDAERHWPEILARYDFEIALLPQDWPLASILRREPGWRLVYRDEVAVLFVRTAARVKENAAAAEYRNGE